MRGCATIGIDDDLAPGQTGVAIGATDFETPRRVDVDDGFVGDEAVGQHIVEYRHDVVAKHRILSRVAARMLTILPGQAVIDSVLGGDNQRRRADRHLVFIRQCHLALGVWFEKRRHTRVAVGGHFFEDLV